MKKLLLFFFIYHSICFADKNSWQEAYIERQQEYEKLFSLMADKCFVELFKDKKEVDSFSLAAENGKYIEKIIFDCLERLERDLVYNHTVKEELDVLDGLVGGKSETDFTNLDLEIDKSKVKILKLDKTIKKIKPRWLKADITKACDQVCGDFGMNSAHDHREKSYRCENVNKEMALLQETGLTSFKKFLDPISYSLFINYELIEDEDEREKRKQLIDFVSSIQVCYKEKDLKFVPKSLNEKKLDSEYILNSCYCSYRDESKSVEERRKISKQELENQFKKYCEKNKTQELCVKFRTAL